MVSKTASEAREGWDGEREEETLTIAELRDQLQAARQELEERNRRIEEYFIKANDLVMEAELARIELNQIFNTASDGMWIMDEQFTVIKINNALSALLNRGKDEVIGRKCHDLFQGSLYCADDCLRAVSRAIDECARRPPDLAARYGGEEFAVILPNTTAEGAVYLAETIRTRVAELKMTHDFSPVQKCVTLSLGVSSIVPEDDSDPQALIAASDRALYEAKRAGRNRVFLQTFSLRE